MDIAKENDGDNKNRKKHRNLLNYEEFLKYCHKHFPHMSNKELASIFNRLARDELIDLQDLIDYISNLDE